MIKNISNLGDASVYCDFGSEVNEIINSNVIDYFNHLSKLVDEEKIEGIKNLTPSYNKLIISFDLSVTNFSKLKDIIKNLIIKKDTKKKFQKIKIPVCCDEEYGLDFERLFKKAIKNGFVTVAHAGEEGPPEYIWEALSLLKVKRIDHGIQCLRDKKLVEKLRTNQIPLTVCPLSNIKLCIFKKLEDHNLKKMLDEKLMVMVNSDDPAYFGGYINENLIEIQTALKLSVDDIKTLIINSFKSSLLSEKEKKEWISKI